MKLSVAVILTGLMTVGANVCRQRSCLAGQAVNGAITIKELRCEYLKNPLGINTLKPRFTWILDSSRRGQMQSAYRVLVSNNKSKLQSNIGDKWDSGKVNSDQSVNIVYQGKPLISNEICYWKVRCWDNNERPGKFSEPARFEMAFLQDKDWQGKWIAFQDRQDYTQGKSGQAVMLDGKSQGIRVPHYPALKPEHITISAWINQRQFTDKWQSVVRKNDGGTSGGVYYLALGKEYGKSGIWFGLVVNETYVGKCAEIDESILTDGNWHHLIACFDGQYIKIYLDGGEIGKWNVPGKMSAKGNTDLEIGRYNTEFFDGAIDEIRIYNRALNSTEIKDLFQGKNESWLGLVGYWPLDGNMKNSVAGKDGIFTGSGKNNMSPLFRKQIVIAKNIQKARVSFCGLGYGELYINGSKVADEVLSPALGDYYQHISYRKYDVTEMLSTGKNAIGFILGNGWFSAPFGKYFKKPWAGSPQALLQLNVEYTDGTSQIFYSDKSWKVSFGSIGQNDLTYGEHYDARW